MDKTEPLLPVFSDHEDFSAGGFAEDASASLPAAEEAVSIFSIAWPVALSSFCRLVMAVTDISVLGRLENGTEYLAAASLAFVWMDITISMPAAASDALNQLCSQANGANNLSLVGRWLQIGATITTIMCIPVIILWSFTEDILIFLGTSHRLASLAQEFAWWSTIGIIPNNFYYAIRQYFQAQKIVKPALYNNVVFIFLNLFLNILFVFGVSIGPLQIPGLGFIGSPIATSVSRTLQPLAFVLYTCAWKKLHVPTWPSGRFLDAFTRRRLQEFFSQTIPTMLGSVAEQWQLEIITLMAAHLGTVDVATQSATFNVFLMLHCFAFGIAKATTCRVGFHLGSGEPKNAKQSAFLSFSMATFVGVVIGVLLVVGRHEIGHIYSGDPAVWKATSDIATILGVGYVGCSWLITFSGVIFGQGRPKTVAIIGIICSWIVSLPLAYALAFPANLRLRGLWYGITCGYLLYTIAAGYQVYRSNWTKYSIEAIRRSEHRFVSTILPASNDVESSSSLHLQH